MRRDLGDYQTPPELVAAVLETLGPIGARWPRVLEPTCGRGEFLAGLVAGPSPPREILGIEIQGAYCEAARRVVGRGDAPTALSVVEADLFRVDLARDLRWSNSGPLLVVGNPPWVTNAGLGVLGSPNLPRKSNPKALRGLEARTGASNFDIAEAIWLKLIAELAGEGPTIALLCKTAVARNVLEFARRADLPIAAATLRKIDAPRWFGAAVDACLFTIAIGPGGPPGRVPVFDALRDTIPGAAFGFAGGRLVADLARYEPFAFADGRSPWTWRQGLKHDAASVMELTREGPSGPLRNKQGERVDVEPRWVFPLRKGSDLGKAHLDPAAESPPGRAVIVTQRRLGQETRRLESLAPRLWSYLEAHAPAFEARKSSIYRGQPPFAMFGIGPYSFAPYKVAVSGLGKEPTFVAIGPIGGRPVMLDDTCYFLAFHDPAEASLAAALLKTPEAIGLVHALLFRDAKRPVTKAILQRIDLAALAARVPREALLDRAEAELARLVPPATIAADDGRSRPHPYPP